MSPPYSMLRPLRAQLGPPSRRLRVAGGGATALVAHQSQTTYPPFFPCFLPTPFVLVMEAGWPRSPALLPRAALRRRRSPACLPRAPRAHLTSPVLLEDLTVGSARTAWWRGVGRYALLPAIVQLSKPATGRGATVLFKQLLPT